MSENQDIKDGLSWWEYEHFLKDTDYTIVGSGIVGISTAIELKSNHPESKVLVIDKKLLPIGASTKNAGFACFGSPSEISDDYKAYGEDVCKKLIQMRWIGLNILKSRVSKSKMYFQSRPGAEIFGDVEEFELYRNELSFINAMVEPIVERDDCFRTSKGPFGFEIVNELEGSINPQLMLKELEFIARKQGVMFMTGVEVKEIKYTDRLLITNLGKMRYSKLIVCTNGFSHHLLPEIDIKPARNQVLITNPISGFRLEHCYHMDKGYIYFREYDGRLLIGGGRNLDAIGETTDEFGTTETIIAHLEEIIRQRILPESTYTIAHSWSGILGVGQTKMPLVKFVHDDVLVAIRMGGMGVAVGSFIGKVAAGMLLSLDNSAHQLYVS